MFKLRCSSSDGVGVFLLVGVLAGLTGCGASTTIAGSTPAPTAQISVSISGSGQVREGATAQLSASVLNTTNTAVTWQVNGVTGGASATGTITTAGLYTAPAALPTVNPVSITAVSNALTSASATVAETVLNPVPAISSATAVQTGTGSPVVLDVLGTNFISGAQIQVLGSSIATTYISATELQASVTVATGVTTIALDVLNPNPGSASSTVDNVNIQFLQVSLASAARLLDQATFGPTLTGIAHVQSVGLQGYLNEQFAVAPTIEQTLPNPLPASCSTSNKGCQQSYWWQAALAGPDQLRQRVAFALSEIMVISTNQIDAGAAIAYQNVLVNDAFGNFSTLLHDVTLSTGMGGYLNMLNSAKPATGQIANENYAREAMQLFTIGIYLLNQDGTPQLDSSGNMIPAYTEAQVQAFARAYTGWTYSGYTGGTPGVFPQNIYTYNYPMGLFEAQHDLTAKTLLNGTTLPAGQTGTQDLAGALGNLFNHPNVGPFIGRQLIQHLVTSNPSPAYVARISAVFANDGTGVRGNLQAVVQAILLDPEARAGDTNSSYEGGHLREPMLYLANVLRGLSYTNTDTTGYYGTLSNYSSPLSQVPYAAGSVFNFFPPDYQIPGSAATAPEFGLENTASAILRLTLANRLVYNQLTGFAIDLSATSTLGQMAANPGNLVDSLGVIFMHGQMPTAMRTDIVNHISTFTDPAERARVATYLVITSSLYKVMH